MPMRVFNKKYLMPMTILLISDFSSENDVNYTLNEKN